MDRDAAKWVSESALQPYRVLGYDALVARFVSGSPAPEWSEVRDADGKAWRIQIQGFWDSEPSGDLRVMAAVDDGTQLGSMRPANSDFIIAPDGHFVGE